MVGYTPSLSTAVWVGTVPDNVPIGNRFGCRGLRFGAAVRHLEVDDGRRLEGHLERELPQADRDRWLCRGALSRRRRPRRRRETVIQPSIEVAPGITIPGRAADDDHCWTAATASTAAAAAAGAGGPPAPDAPP